MGKKLHFHEWGKLTWEQTHQIGKNRSNDKKYGGTSSVANQTSSAPEGKVGFAPAETLEIEED